MKSKTFLGLTAARGSFDLTVRLSFDRDPVGATDDLQLICMPNDLPRSGPRSEVQPHLNAFYDKSSEQLVIKLVEANCIKSGQGFFPWLVLQCVEANPDIRSVYLDNLMGAEYQRAKAWLATVDRVRPYEHQPETGPLVKGLLKAGFGNMEALADARQSSVVSLCASRL